MVIGSMDCTGSFIYIFELDSDQFFFFFFSQCLTFFQAAQAWCGCVYSSSSRVGLMISIIPQTFRTSGVFSVTRMSRT